MRAVTAPRDDSARRSQRVSQRVSKAKEAVAKDFVEQAFYEVFNQDNVDLVALDKDPIAQVVPTGIQLESGAMIELDALILATGFNAVTGGFSRVNIRGVKNKTLNGEWSSRARTLFGMSTSGFPISSSNMGRRVRPCSPVGRCYQIQAIWIIATMVYMRQHGYSKVDATPEKEAEWARCTNEACAQTLLPHKSSWYMGGNVPGKQREALGLSAGCLGIKSI
ncbi:hypothetical protein BDW75DRAFT_244561 [Aspergillus navahoensis]